MNVLRNVNKVKLDERKIEEEKKMDEKKIDDRTPVIIRKMKSKKIEEDNQMNKTVKREQKEDLKMLSRQMEINKVHLMT